MYMKLTNANAIRAKYLEILMGAVSEEDTGIIASNSFNFPVVADDGEEGWVEIVIKVPKENGDEGFDKREEYRLKCAEKAEKAKVNAEKKAKKIERDKAMREAKKAKEGQ